MAKTKISEFSSTPGNNTDIDSINIAEGCAPSGINDAIRELMAQLKDFQTGAVGDSFNGPVGTTTAAAGAFTTLTTSSTVTLSGGTANGVAYLNGSKVLTTGSALTFDGTTFTVPSDIASPGSPIIYSYNGGSAGSVRAGVQFVGTDPSIRSYISGSEQMRLTSTGLGIGTSSPSAKLDVRGTIQSVASGAGLSAISSSTFYYMNVSSTGLDTYTDANASAPMLFRTGGTERMRIDSSGNLLVGTTSYVGGVGNARLTAKTSTTGVFAAGFEGYYGVGINASSATGNLMYFYYNSGGTPVGSISTNGTTVSYNTSSDYRLKNTIAPMTGALAKVAALKPCTYKWNADGSAGEGFIAHELAEVCPAAVTGEKDAVDAEGNPRYQGIDTSFLVATLTAALQEAVAEINQLKARLDAANL